MVQKHDFIQINYTGKLISGEIFDTTDEKIAKENKIHNSKMTYKPITICVGERQVIKGLDDQIIGKEVGKTYTFKVESKDAFGKKDAKLVKLVPSNIFKSQNIKPFVGLEIQIDGEYGVIRSINGGRTLVDFNHPLSGKDVEYDIEIIKKVDDVKEQIKSLLSLTLGIEPNIKVEGDEATIEQIPEAFREVLTIKILEVTSVKKVNYI